MTAKHVLKDHNIFYIYILFLTYTSCLIFKCHNTLPYLHNRIFQNQHIALIKLQGPLDPLQNIKLEIGELCENEELYFYTLERGCFVKKSCRIIKKTNLDMREKMSANEFVISEAGKEGGSGTPIFSSSGICVGLYIGVFTTKNSLNPVEYGRALQFDRNVIRHNLLINFSSVSNLHIFFKFVIIYIFQFV